MFERVFYYLKLVYTFTRAIHATYLCNKPKVVRIGHVQIVAERIE